ncbi:MAG: hypothetical protein F4086_11455 [Gemmatimonadetes bacterium]|nr:hypothetical protein [Gammaproteobacteria bacterium]MYE92968.1 hypothetical protein [Gemmatimonadota bacterium]MYJ10921.1 hypothetical protein [Gemmatimonadota bacterium]
MKNWTETLTLAVLAVLFTLTLAGCAEDGSNVAAVPEPAPGDPAIYAPDGWPLQIGDRPSDDQMSQIWKGFLRYRGIEGMHLVGDRVYGARFINGVYEGHFPAKARWAPEMATALVSRTRAESESLLPERFRGRIEYKEPSAAVRFDEKGEPYLVRELLSPMHAQREERRKQREEERRKR